jgi:phosphate starvation-inducible PhoH-like protein
VEARNILSEVEGLAFCYFNEGDVVRHHLVRLIIKAYQQHAQSELEANGNGSGIKEL